MKKRSAGVMLYRRAAEGVEVLLLHPGGLFWAKKDAGAWSIPKGELETPRTRRRPRVAVRRGDGVALAGELLPLGGNRQKNGKEVLARSGCSPG